MTSIARAALAALLLAAAACGDRDRPEAADEAAAAVEDAGEEVREGARELGKALHEYTYDERENFRSAAREQLDELNADIDELVADSRETAGAVSEEALNKVRAARDEAREALGRLDDATEERWGEVRTGVADALQNAHDAVADLRSTRGPMGGRGPG